MTMDQAAKESRQAYINRRATQIYENRLSQISTADFIVALNRIATLPREICRLQHLVFSGDHALATEIQETVRAALYCDSVDIAIAEAFALDDAPPVEERH